MLLSLLDKTLSLLLDLAPDEGYLSIQVTLDAGGLLHHLFTLTWPIGPWRYVSVVLSTDRSVRWFAGIVPFGVRTFLVPHLRYATIRRTQAKNNYTMEVPSVNFFDGIWFQRPQNDFGWGTKTCPGSTQPFNTKTAAHIQAGVLLLIQTALVTFAIL